VHILGLFFSFSLKQVTIHLQKTTLKFINHNCPQSIHLSNVSCPLSFYLIFLSLSEHVQRIQEFPQNNILGVMQDLSWVCRHHESSNLYSFTKLYVRPQPTIQSFRIYYTALELSIKSPSVSPPISSAFGPSYPLFQWYLQSNEIWLNLGMKCWNSAFNAQGSRVIIVVVQVRAVKIYVAAAQCRRSRKRKHRMKLSLPPKWVEKVV
jgi:hypothetical protein